MTSSRTEYRKIRLGLGHAYLITAGTRCLLIDTGSVNQQKTLIRHLTRLGISAGQIGLIVITHTHFDHVGSLKAIKDLCQCPAAIHEEESQLLRQGVMVVPPGTDLFGRVASYVGRKFMNRLLTFPPVEPDILITEDFFLESFGIPGKIVPTQGHTEGSLSVLLESGEAFVGDLAANHLPFGLGPILPPFAKNLAQLLSSWENLLSSGATLICPTHGKPFPADLLRKRLEKERAGLSD